MTQRPLGTSRFSEWKFLTVIRMWHIPPTPLLTIHPPFLSCLAQQWTMTHKQWTDMEEVWAPWHPIGFCKKCIHTANCRLKYLCYAIKTIGGQLLVIGKIAALSKETQHNKYPVLLNMVRERGGEGKTDTGKWYWRNSQNLFSDMEMRRLLRERSAKLTTAHKISTNYFWQFVRPPLWAAVRSRRLVAREGYNN